MERAVFVPDLDRLPPPGEPYDRLYLGSEFCVWRLPSVHELHEALAAVTRCGMGFSLVTPFLDEPGLTCTLALIRALPAGPATEVIANDLGLIEALRAAGWPGTVVAGRLLTRQRRGPGFQSFGEVPPAAAAALRGSALDSPAFVDLLGSVYGVKRFELDDLVQGVSVPALPAGVRLSLYRPHLLVTATRNCPWVFDGRSWDRSHGCARPCRGQALRLGQNANPLDPPLRKGEAGVGPLSRDGESGDQTPCIPLCQRGKELSCIPLCQRGKEGVSPPSLVLGGCAQFLEHRSEAPPPAGVDRIVWQPDIPA